MTAVASAVGRFNGFPDETIQFLLELQAEQSRTWFKAHQADYLRVCRQPLELFVTELCQRLADVYPGIAEAEPHFFRIQRDTRFSKNKEPYKTNLAADVPIRPRLDGELEHGLPGLYVSFGLEGEFIGIGAWHMSPAVLQRYRALLDNPRQGAQFQKLVDALLARGCQVEAMEKLKRVPPPYAQDHPRAELLKHKGLAIMSQPKENVSGSRRLLDWAEAELRASAPLIRLLDRALTTT
ncbi:MAG TPA: DUF2461 domain-containing protein [Chloroflexota bacterium]|nr:DUF2461 domain-containing protein [Chloroflexota bacterium]